MELMTLLDFTIQLTRTNELLARIADALERAIPVPPEERLGFRKRGAEAVIRYGDNEKSWAKEELYSMIHPHGLAPALEQEVLDRAMENYGVPLEDQSDEGVF
jgi:hypothetical protein